MTVQDLKENREAILKIIADYTTPERTKEAMEILADETSLKYCFTENVLTYVNDTLSLYFGKQKVGIAEMISEINGNKTFNLLTKKYN